MRYDFNGLHMPTDTSSALKRALAETDAMRALAELLAALPDDESRVRVLRWSQEHFRLAVRVPPSSADDDERPSAPAGGDAADPALAIDDDLFDGPAKKPEPIHCEGSDPARELVVDDSVFESVTIDEEDLEVRATDLDTARAVESKPAGLDSLLRDFVADFQRLALAWQVA